jgi:hypothetical protein
MTHRLLQRHALDTLRALRGVGGAVERTVGEPDERGSLDAQAVQDGVEPSGHAGGAHDHFRGNARAELTRAIHEMARDGSWPRLATGRTTSWSCNASRAERGPAASPRPALMMWMVPNGIWMARCSGCHCGTSAPRGESARAPRFRRRRRDTPGCPRRTRNPWFAPLAPRNATLSLRRMTIQRGCRRFPTSTFQPMSYGPIASVRLTPPSMLDGVRSGAPTEFPFVVKTVFVPLSGRDCSAVAGRGRGCLALGWARE